MQPFVVSDHSAASCTTRQFGHGAWSIPAHGALQRNTGTSAIFCPLLLKKQTFIYFYCVFQLFLKLDVPTANRKEGCVFFESFNERVGTLTPASAKEKIRSQANFFKPFSTPWSPGLLANLLQKVLPAFADVFLTGWYDGDMKFTLRVFKLRNYSMRLICDEME